MALGYYTGQHSSRASFCHTTLCGLLKSPCFDDTILLSTGSIKPHSLSCSLSLPLPPLESLYLGFMTLFIAIFLRSLFLAPMLYNVASLAVSAYSR